MARNDYETAVKAAGMIITDIRTVGTTTIIEALIETKRGTLTIKVGDFGNAILHKPNGSYTHLYEKSAAQLLTILKRTIDFNN
jgi:hypothetical protein